MTKKNMEFESILLPGVEDKRPIIISGPCSAETEEQVMETAKKLAEKGVKIFRAGVWKPRTKPGGFEGVGTPALKWLQQVRKETGMYVATEVATEKHVYESLKYNMDMLWIGARTTANPFAVQEIADTLRGVDIPVLIKNPVNPDLELWIGAIERLYNAGIKKIGVIHRGFIESHRNPDDAWSDSSQQISPETLAEILNELVIRDKVQSTEDLSDLRRQIDDLDNEILQLLSKRMRVSREIGLYKLEHDMPVLQTGRYDHIRKDRVEQAEKMEMAGEFALKILEAIHTESVRQQFEVMERAKK